MLNQGELSLGAKLRDAGAAQVVERLSPAEREAIITVILDGGDRFSPDDVRVKLSPGLVEKLDAFPNFMGGVFLQLAKADKIEQTGEFDRSPRPERRKGRVFFWRVIPHESPLGTGT